MMGGGGAWGWGEEGWARGEWVGLGGRKVFPRRSGLGTRKEALVVVGSGGG